MKDIYSYITSEEANYKAMPVPIAEGWEWSMPNHVRKTLFYKHGIFTDDNDENKPFKNIVLPILRLRYRTEGIDVKDINLYINSRENYWKSFLIKKYHDKFARENNVDMFLDEASENDIDYGGVLVKDIGETLPQVVPFERIAFCDQTSILSGVICEKHNYSPSELLEMKSVGWGDKNSGATITIEDLIVLSQAEKSIPNSAGQKAKTPGKYIEIYELHGYLPSEYLSEDTDEEKEYSNQMHIVAYYKDQNDDRQGVTLFKSPEKKSPYRFRADKIFGRALGFGGVEELFHSQIWTNYSMIRMKEMLDSAAKTILQTADASFKTRNSNLNSVDNLEVLVVEDGKPVSQIDTYPRNLVLFDNAVKEWEVHAKEMGASTDSIQGVQPASGTPFKLQELLVNQSSGLHEHRQGKFAKFIEELYREIILPKIVREIVSGVEFLSELTLDEMKYIVDGVVRNQSKKYFTEKVLNGETIQPGEQDAYEQSIRDNFMKGGRKKFIKVLKDELKDIPVDIEINIAGKQKNLARMTDKIVNIFRQVISTPQILQVPGMADLFNQIIEYSGLNPVDFSGLNEVVPQQEGGGGTEALQDLNESSKEEK